MKLSVERVARAALQAKLSSRDAFCAYLYDLHSLREHAAQLVRSLPEGCELFYAVKANSDEPLLRTLAPVVAGFEVASGGELSWVSGHCPGVPLVFGGPGKTDEELRLALQRNVDRVHVESPGELERLAWFARTVGVRAQVLLRVNLRLEELPATSLTMGGRPSPFGMDIETMDHCLTWLKSHPEIELKGFHFHLVSHQLDALAHLRLLAAYFRAVRSWREAYSLQVEEINVGGGIGINYREPRNQFDWDRFADGLAELLRDMPDRPARVRFEMGRYISAACGFYAMEVLDIKESLGRAFLVARGGTHHFRTPYAQGHSHPFQVIEVEHWPHPYRRREIRDRAVSVVGQLCTPKDVLASDAWISRARVGDLLLFSYAGAYAWHISHHGFLRHPQPAQLYLPAREICHVG